MRKVSFSLLVLALVCAGLLAAAGPAAAQVCPGTPTVYNGGGTEAVEVRCEVVPGYEVGAGAGVFAYSGMAGAGAGAAVCYPVSPSYQCINPQNFAVVSTSGYVFALSGVCFAPYPCDYGAVYANSGGAGVQVNLDSYGISRGVHIP